MQRGSDIFLWFRGIRLLLNALFMTINFKNFSETFPPYHLMLHFSILCPAVKAWSLIFTLFEGCHQRQSSNKQRWSVFIEQFLFVYLGRLKVPRCRNILCFEVFHELSPKSLGLSKTGPRLWDKAKSRLANGIDSFS